MELLLPSQFYMLMNDFETKEHYIDYFFVYFTLKRKVTKSNNVGVDLNFHKEFESEIKTILDKYNININDIDYNFSEDVDYLKMKLGNKCYTLELETYSPSNYGYSFCTEQC